MKGTTTAPAKGTMTAQHQAVTRPSIISPAIDFLAVGGLSLIFFVPLLLSGRTDLLIIGAGAQALIAGAINMPHFMASYRMVYRDRATIFTHRWASIYVPAILVAYVIFALWYARTSPVFLIVFATISGTYLAVHYTGQAWGMMASYAYLDGTRFEPVERRLVRWSLWILLAWHVTWFLYTQLNDPSKVRSLYAIISAGTAVAFLLGAFGLYKLWRRTGRLPARLSIVAWISIFVWYAVLARDPKAIFWVQIAHAIQYLAFPIRVEINRTTRSRSARAGSVVRHMAVYLGLLMLTSLFVGLVVPGSAMDVVGGIFGEESGRAAPVLVLMFINIHHYFTDGVIWKISNPEVRKDLFAHAVRG